MGCTCTKQLPKETAETEIRPKLLGSEAPIPAIKEFPGKPYFDRSGTKFADLLGRGCLAVVKASYFEHCFENGEPFQDRASIPEEFFIDGQEVLREWRAHGAKFLIIFSYSWLSQQHPDPNMYHLERIVALLKGFKGLLANEYKVAPAEVGIILDFCSLWQKREMHETRTEQQLSEFKEALGEINTPYGHRDVTAIKLTGVSPDVIRSYDDRGWTLFESAVIDGKVCSPDLNNVDDNRVAWEWKSKFGRCNAMAVPEDFDPSVVDYEEFGNDFFDQNDKGIWKPPRIVNFEASKKDPMTPQQFQRAMKEREARAAERGVPLFTNGRDQPFVLEKFQKAYVELGRPGDFNLKRLAPTGSHE